MEKQPIIDMHTHLHVNLGRPGIFVEAMEDSGVEKAVLLSMPFPLIGTNAPLILFARTLCPDRFAAFTAIDYRDLTSAGFAGNAVARLEEDAFRGGAQGIKMYIQNAAVMLHPNDERLQPFLDRAGQLGLPILMHVAIDPERGTSALARRAEFGPERLADDLEEVLERHAGTNIVIAHLGCCLSERGLENLGRLFESHANLYADTSATFLFFQMLRYPRRYAEFLERHSGQIVFGTDMDLSAEIDADPLRRYYAGAYRVSREFYGTRGAFALSDEFRRRRREWVHVTDEWEDVEVFGDSPVGLGLSPDCLKRVLHANAARLLGEEREPDGDWIVGRLTEMRDAMRDAADKALQTSMSYTEHFIDIFRNSRRDFESALKEGGSERLRDTVSRHWTFPRDHTRVSVEALNERLSKKESEAAGNDPRR
jgi:predicted TIM-barrel fold metal-dependent hydrolase